MSKNFVIKSLSALFLTCVGQTTSAESSSGTFSVVGQQTYMVSDSSLFFGNKWVPRNVDGFAIIKDDQLIESWDYLPETYPETVITQISHTHCRINHEDLPDGFVWSYKTSNGWMFYETNTAVRRKSYMEFDCNKN